MGGLHRDDDWGAALRYKNTFADAWQLAAGVAYEDFRDERLQAGAGGLATGIVPIPSPSPSGSGGVEITFFQRDFQEWAGSAALKHKPSGLFAVGVFSTSATDDTNAIGFFNVAGRPT